MIDGTCGDAGPDETRLAEEVAELADRVARGEVPDVGPIEEEPTGPTEVLHRLLPAIRWLAELGGDGGAGEDPGWAAPPADVLGDFRLGREIGRGGIGVVYEARQLSLGRKVALKVLPPAARLDPRQRRRFEIEAQAAAALEHPNIVPVFACGDEGGVPYLAMRLIEGRNLARVVRDLRERTGRGLPPRQAAGLARQAAEALDYAHRHDVLHRDIKPSNLLVDADGHLWVVDFGLAHVQGDSDLTASGDVIGTLRYLSPEQAKGRRGSVDGRSDVYALGATLYELLTLRPVVEGDDRAGILIRIIAEEPRFSRKEDSAIPMDLRTIVLKALAKDPAERYATAGEMAEDLGLFLDDRPIRARRPTIAMRAARWARRHGEAVVASGLLAALLLMGLVAVSLWSNARLRSINQRLEAEIDRADRHAREAQEHARLADRHAVGAQLRLAAQAVDAGQAERAQEILRDVRGDAGPGAPSFAWRYLRRRARREVEVLVGPTPNFREMMLSPDGRLLATTDPTAGLVLRDAATGAAIRTLDAWPVNLGKPVFSPDGSLIAVVETTTDGAARHGIAVWEVASGRRLARLPVEAGPDGCRCGFLPGGTLGVFVFGGGERRDHRCAIWGFAEDRGHPRLLERFEKQPTVGPDWYGGAMVTREDRATVGLREDVTGRPFRPFRTEGDDQAIAVAACSADGRVVAIVSWPSRRLTLWEGRTGKRLASHLAPPDVVRLLVSPDGARLAAIDVKRSVQLVECADGVTRTIVSAEIEHPRESHVAFSPDGRRVATASARRHAAGRPSQVSLWDAATGRRLANFPGRAEEFGDLTFEAGGRSLLISSRSGVRRWWIPAGDAEGMRQPAGHQDEGWSVAFSPDGRAVATGSDDDGCDETIRLWDPATGRLIQGWKGGEGTVASLAFSPDGSVLASGHIVRGGRVRIWDPATGRKLADLAGHRDRVRAVAFSPDGRTLASASSDATVRLWDAASWGERDVLRGHTDTVHAVAFSPDGRTIASAGNDGDIRLWDLSDRPGSTAPPRVLRNRTNLMALAYSPGGEMLAAADTLGSVTVWDPGRSAILRVIHGDGDELRQLAFSPDGAILAAGSIKGSVGLWDPLTGQELMNLDAHRAQVNGLAFSPDGSILGSVAHDGSVRLWRDEP